MGMTPADLEAAAGQVRDADLTDPATAAAVLRLHGEVTRRRDEIIAAAHAAGTAKRQIGIAGNISRDTVYRVLGVADLLSDARDALRAALGSRYSVFTRGDRVFMDLSPMITFTGPEDDYLDDYDRAARDRAERVQLENAARGALELLRSEGMTFSEDAVSDLVRFESAEIARR